MDRLLDDPGVLDPLRPEFEARCGRSPLPLECYLRLAFLQDRYGIPYEALCANMATSPAARRFCRLGVDSPVPDPPVLEEITACLGPPFVAALNQLLRARAAAADQGALPRLPPRPSARRHRRRMRLLRTLTGAIAVVALAAFALAPSRSSGASRSTGTTTTTAVSRAHTAATRSGPTANQRAKHSGATSPAARKVVSGPPADQRRLVLVHSIGGPISPKSVDASGTGLVFAQNMMYRHTVTVYNSGGTLMKTIPDSVNLAAFGIPGHPGMTRGAPVEAAFTHDARYAYVSNYSMYGAGMGPEGSDTCTPASARAAGDTDSYVYRISTATLSIDQVIEVGLVPKYLAVSPDDRYLLVANWCSYDLSIVSLAEGRQVARLPMGAYPRGIAVSP